MRAVSLAVLLAAIPAMTAAEGPMGPTGWHTFCIADNAPAGGGAPTAPPISKIGMLPGFGTGGFPVATSSKDAQAWFNQGMRLAHAFNHAEATDAFKESEKQDPTCAMCAWGEAWSLGPTINFGISADDMKAAAAVADKAVVLAKGGPERELLLAQAVAKRYRDTAGKGSGDKAFAEAMDKLADRYPDDSEIAVMAADAQMIRVSLYNDKSGLQRAINLLEGVLRARPNDTGAIHFYIHATEMAGLPAKAEPYADKLGTLAPSAGHLVHMPSHTFFWVGRYADAADVNVKAAAVDDAHLIKMGLPPDTFRRSYHAHNVHFGIGGAMMSGEGAEALKLADTFLGVQKTLKPDEGWLQVSSSSGYYAYARYGASAEAVPAPPADRPYASLMYHYARGEAFVRKGDLASARRELGLMSTRGGTFKAFGGLSGTADMLAEIARQVLDGRIALASGDLRTADRDFRKAWSLQAKVSDSADPPLWWYPVRRSIAAVALAQGRNADAAKEAAASLAAWPNDPVALKLKAEAERRLGQTADAGRDLAQARKGWKGNLDAYDLKGA